MKSRTLMDDDQSPGWNPLQLSPAPTSFLSAALPFMMRLPLPSCIGLSSRSGRTEPLSRVTSYLDDGREDLRARRLIYVNGRAEPVASPPTCSQQTRRPSLEQEPR